MSSIMNIPVHIAQAGLKMADDTLENISLAAEAANRSLGPMPPVTVDFDENQHQSLVGKGIEAFRSQVKRGLPVTGTPIHLLEAVSDAINAKNHPAEGMDDRKLGLEYGLTMLSRAPPGPLVKELEHAAIRTLYRDLPHPPATNMGQEWSFRSADGSGNSRTDPEMGASFTPYSRSCASVHPLPASELPDPGLIFDMLERRDKFVPHPAGLSGLFFNFATTVIHSVFRTSRLDWNINETSSYVDLGILYGNRQDHQDRIRIVDGRGMVVPDAFAETRLLSLPPGVSSIIVLFSRNHNYIAKMLLAINEKGKWTQDVSKLSEADKIKQDYEIFQTTRLINSFTYGNVVLGDYLACILGTNRDGSSWSLDIVSEHREKDHTLLERGQGNSCSVEFNTLYRLHPTMSQEDEAYIEKVFGFLFGKDVDFDKLTPQDFEIKVSALKTGKPMSDDEFKKLNKQQRDAIADDSGPDDYGSKTFGLKIDPASGRPTGHFNRDPKTLRFDDADLAKALQDATAVPAAAFKARGVPGVMRVIEIMGISQARNWGCCTMNEFRRFLGLKPYANFEDWNPDPVIADAARKLYRNVENLELYVGLVAEDSKKVMDGAGLCPSYTMSRAILADAVALLRGDRYFTHDLTPYNLTAWGFTEGNRNTKNAANGGMIGKLMLRNLPFHYDAESTWSHFPFVTPTGQPHSIDKILKRIGQSGDYSLARPVKTGLPIIVSDPNAIFLGLQDTKGEYPLVPLYTKGVLDLGLKPSFLSAIASPAKYAQATSVVQNTFVPVSGYAQAFEWFENRTKELLKEKNLRFAKSKGASMFGVDVVKDVLRIVPVHWAASKIAGIPVKTTHDPRGFYYEAQLYQMLTEIYTFLFKHGDPTMKIPNRREAKSNVERLLRFVKISLEEAKGGLAATVMHSVAGLVLGTQTHTFAESMKRALAVGKSTDETANDVLAFISASTAELSQIFSHVVNFYMVDQEPDRFAADEVKTAHTKAKAQMETIVKLASEPYAKSAEALKRYAKEALRLDPVVDGVWRIATAGSHLGPYDFEAGDKLWFDFRAAGQDAQMFPDPETVNVDRPQNMYKLIQGDTAFAVLGEDFVYGATVAVMRAVFSLPNVRRGSGPAGTLRRFKEPVLEPTETVERVKAKGKDVNGKDVEFDHYKWAKTDEGAERTWRYSYIDPENENRLTQFATGMLLYYD